VRNVDIGNKGSEKGDELGGQHRTKGEKVIGSVRVHVRLFGI